MQSNGYHYSPIVLDERYRPGGDDVELAKRNGFAAFSYMPSQNDLAIQSMSSQEAESWTQALVGTGDHTVTVELASGRSIEANTDGCLAAAHQVLYGDIKAYTAAIYDWMAVRQGVRERADEVLAGSTQMHRWSECLNSLGYSFETPSEMTQSTPLEFMSNINTWREYENSLSVKSAKCSSSSGLADRMDQEFSSELANLSPTEIRELGRYSAMQQAALLSLKP